MAAPKRTPFQREQDLLEISKLYLKGHTQFEISSQLGYSQPQISYDLKILRRRWLQSSLVNLNEAKAKELAKIDKLELEYWNAWHKSQEDAEVITLEVLGNPEKKDSQIIVAEKARKSTRREGQSGNPAYLTGVQWCINKRCQILGLDAADRAEIEWRVEVIRLIRDGTVSPHDVIEELGRDLASELFTAAGVSVTPDREAQSEIKADD